MVLRSVLDAPAAWQAQKQVPRDVNIRVHNQTGGSGDRFGLPARGVIVSPEDTAMRDVEVAAKAMFELAMQANASMARGVGGFDMALDLIGAGDVPTDRADVAAAAGAAAEDWRQLADAVVAMVGLLEQAASAAGASL